MRMLVVVALMLAVAHPVVADETARVEPRELLSALKKKDQKILVLDVRSEAEYQSGHVPGAVHIPYDEVVDRIDEIRSREPDRVIVYCERGGRAAKAEHALTEAGVQNIEHLEGDMKAWREKKLPVRQPLTSVLQK